jgi:RNA polymerase sigma-70 factor (ECF subfamily)
MVTMEINSPAASGAAATMNGCDESAMIARLRAGDERAFESLVREHSGRLYAVAFRLLRHEDDARDAVQDAFMQACRAIGGFNGQSQLSTWLHRIVTNAALMKLRSRKRRPEESIEAMLPRFAEDGHRVTAGEQSWDSPVEELAERAEVCQMVRRNIDRLPETHRTILMMRDIEELDTAETAALLGIATGAVKTRLHRARMALRELLVREAVAL